MVRGVVAGLRRSDDVSAGIDGEGPAVATAESAEVVHLAVLVEEGMLRTAALGHVGADRPADDLADVIDALGATVAVEVAEGAQVLHAPVLVEKCVLHAADY